jgi:hypothetical protein
MKGKNWDKPLSWEGFDKRSWSEVFLYHGLRGNWKYAEEHGWYGPETRNDRECYERYLNHCKIMSSPLGKALL